MKQEAVLVPKQWSFTASIRNQGKDEEGQNETGPLHHGCWGCRKFCVKRRRRRCLWFFPMSSWPSSSSNVCPPCGVFSANLFATVGTFFWGKFLFPLLLEDSLQTRLLVEAIWRCLNGPEAKAAPGMGGHVPLLLVMAIWRWCNGREAKAVPGTSGLVPMLLMEAIWRSYSGRKAKVVPGMRTPVPMLPVEAIWRRWNGHEAKDAPGMRGHSWRPFGGDAMGTKPRLYLAPGVVCASCKGWRPFGGVGMGQRGGWLTISKRKRCKIKSHT